MILPVACTRYGILSPARLKRKHVSLVNILTGVLYGTVRTCTLEYASQDCQSRVLVRVC
jgi:hypothetical protein